MLMYINRWNSLFSVLFSVSKDAWDTLLNMDTIDAQICNMHKTCKLVVINFQSWYKFPIQLKYFNL